jgi:hypothetical protein
MILIWEGTYCPSTGELYDFDLRKHVLSIIWEALWFWHDKARTQVKIIALPITSVDDGEYMPSTVKIIELPRWWTVRAFSGQHHRAPQMMHSTVRLRSKSNSSPDDVHYVPSGELYDFDLRRHVLSIIWGALWFWSEKAHTVHHLRRAPQMMDSTCLFRSKSYSSPDDGQHVPSHVKII